MANSARCTAAGLVVFRNYPYRVEYLFLQTSYGKHHWTPPKGFVDETDVSELDAAFRETQEECGLKKEDLILFPDTKHTMQYKIPPNDQLKTVHYWLARLQNDNANVILSDEHQDYRWLNLTKALPIAEYPEMHELLFKYEEYIRTKLCNI